MKTVFRKSISFIMAIVLLLCLVPTSQVSADYMGKPFLHPLFSDRMVLQRDVENEVWGFTNPGESVTVEIGGKVFTGTAGSNGRWSVKIEPFSKGGPYQMNVKGSAEVTVNDIYFGEVWLVSGQSNAAMQLPYVANGDVEVQNSDNPDIRFFTTPFGSSSTPKDTFGYGASWQKCNPQTVGNLSGVAYFFARELKNELDVPIGIISSSVGGTQIESWIGNEALKTFVATVQEPGYQPGSPNVYYNGMIAPLVPVKVKGVIWYQGESNSQYCRLYGDMLRTLISDWRSSFESDELPFVIIQLPNYMQLQTNPVQNDSWTFIREGQLAVSYSEKNVGLVTTIDVGDAEDIHPKNKQDVGKRAALSALGNFYGKNIEHSGPFYSGMTKEGNKIRISFNNAGSGLMLGEKEGLDPVREVVGGTLKGFVIAGQDGKFVWADAVIDGQDVVVSSPSVADPTAVRYAWANNPICNLYNRAGLPASPFRTDGIITVMPTPKTTPIVTPTPTVPLETIGDLNVDGEVDSTDLTYMKRYLLSIIEDFPAQDDLRVADLNCDGYIDSTDLTILKRYVLKIIRELPMT